MGMAKDDDVMHLENRHGIFDRCRRAVLGAVGFIGRHQIGDISQHKGLARAGIEHPGRIDAAVGTGDNHHLGVLALVGHRVIAFPLFGIGASAEAPVTAEELAKFRHMAGFSSPGRFRHAVALAAAVWRAIQTP